MNDSTLAAERKRSNGEAYVAVESMRKFFPVFEGLLQRQVAEIRAVDDVSFMIPRGQTFGLVGESGSGKTTVGRTLLRLTEPTGGSFHLDGTDVFGLSGRDLKAFRRRSAMVFQDPASSLNPRKRVKDIIQAPLDVHNVGTKSERVERVEDLIEMVDLPRDYMYKYPNALSGGQKQRVGIARAVALNPEFIVLDEPTSSLDVSVQARIVSILEDLQEEFDLTYLFISHDLSLIKSVSDRIGIMYLGRLMEVGDAEDVFRNPQHPYTEALLSAIPTVNEEDRKLKPPTIELEGEVPDPREKPTGCAFRTRCPREFSPCDGEEPPMYEVGTDHISRCYLHDDRYAEEFT